jgi:hypothetical protein
VEARAVALLRSWQLQISTGAAVASMRVPLLLLEFPFTYLPLEPPARPRPRCGHAKGVRSEGATPAVVQEHFQRLFSRPFQRPFQRLFQRLFAQVHAQKLGLPDSTPTDLR